MNDATLSKLLAKKAALNSQIKREENKKRVADRKDDTRKKILTGATVLEWAARDQDFSARLMNELGSFLVRDSDRALFGLPPKGEGKS